MTLETKQRVIHMWGDETAHDSYIGTMWRIVEIGVKNRCYNYKDPFSYSYHLEVSTEIDLIQKRIWRELKPGHYDGQPLVTELGTQMKGRNNENQDS